MLCVKNLYKKYRNAENPSVDNLSFDLENGKIIGLLGPNGAGKTTTISIICGLIKNFEGEIKVLGYNIRNEANQVKRKISVVPQQIALYPALSCYDNLLYYGKLYNIKTSEVKRTIENYLKQFGLWEHADKQVKKFSGGMKRRANIIASLINQPELIILDEPTAGVDVQSRSMILDFLKDYNARGNSVIYTSHLLEEAESICDEVLIMDHGRLLIQGEPQQIIKAHNAENLENLFLQLTGSRVRDLN